jgi:hypothetical protein
VASRRDYYPALAARIRIPGIDSVQRDTLFDDEKLCSAGIRVSYGSRTGALAGVKDGILLELGFDDTAPNRPVTISSWAWDGARERGVPVFDNRAAGVLCYAPTHTFVEKLQTISTKYRRLGEAQAFPGNFLLHYYDVYCLLGLDEVRDFVREPAYRVRKGQRFRVGDEQVIACNPAFVLADAAQRQRFAREYLKTAALYYQGQPPFESLLERIQQHIGAL